uniref:Uncharacterized protein n=1 Tax=Panagrolaimus sp. ES5 TaxID=591445 RepID=A0AC34GSW4_9BILA
MDLFPAEMVGLIRLAEPRKNSLVLECLESNSKVRKSSNISTFNNRRNSEQENVFYDDEAFSSYSTAGRHPYNNERNFDNIVQHSSDGPEIVNEENYEIYENTIGQETPYNNEGSFDNSHQHYYGASSYAFEGNYEISDWQPNSSYAFEQNYGQSVGGNSNNTAVNIEQNYGSSNGQIYSSYAYGYEEEPPIPIHRIALEKRLAVKQARKSNQRF